MAEPQPETPDPLDAAVQQAITVCDGDVRAALRVALIANAFLEAGVEELSRAVSFGFLRGRTSARRASDKLEDWREISANKEEGTST
jgi:hypothetical protein